MFDEKSYNIKMDKAIEVFTKELSSLRTGRANAAMLDLVKVDVYGQQMPIPIHLEIYTRLSYLLRQEKIYRIMMKI